MRLRLLLRLSLAALTVTAVAGLTATGCSDDDDAHSYIGAIDADAAPARIGRSPSDAGDGGD